MPLPAIATALAGLLGRSVAGATLRLGTVAQSVGRGVKAASAIAGQSNVPALSRSAAKALGPVAEGAAKGPMAPPTFSLRGVLGKLPGAAFQQMSPRGGITQRIVQSIQTTLNLRPNLQQVPTSGASLPVNAAGLARNMGGDAISRAYADDFAKQKQVEKDAADEQRTAVAQANNEELARSGVKAVLVLNGLAGATLAAGTALYKFTDFLLESRRGAAQFSGPTAGLFAALDVQQLMLDMRSARQTEGSTMALGQAVAEMRQAVQPISKDLTILANSAGVIGAKVVTLLTVAVRYLTPLEMIAKVAERWLPKGQEFGNDPAKQFLLDWADGNFPAQGRQAIPRPAPPPLRNRK